MFQIILYLKQWVILRCVANDCSLGTVGLLGNSDTMDKRLESTSADATLDEKRVERLKNENARLMNYNRVLKFTLKKKERDGFNVTKNIFEFILVFNDCLILMKKI